MLIDFTYGIDPAQSFEVVVVILICWLGRGVAIVAKLRFAVMGLVLAGSIAVQSEARADEPFSWTGFYVGGSVGANWTNDSARMSTGDAATETLFGPGIAAGRIATRYGASDAGIIGGLQSGYNWKLQGLLVGVEADISRSGAEGSATSVFTNGVNLGNSINYTSKLEWLGTVRARLGVLLTPTVLAYATGGLAYGQVSRSYSLVGLRASDNEPLGGFTGHSRSLDTGYTIGGGGEWAMSDKLTLGAEYLYVNLGSSSFTTTTDNSNFVNCAPAACRFNIRSGGAEDQILRLKLNFKL